MQEVYEQGCYDALVGPSQTGLTIGIINSIGWVTLIASASLPQSLRWLRDALEARVWVAPSCTPHEV
eukprot:4970164-Amphidinium_carterae.1